MGIIKSPSHYRSTKEIKVLWIGPEEGGYYPGWY